MKTLNLILCITICIVTSCTQESFFKRKIKQISKFPQESTLQGEKMNLEIIGINNIYIADTIFIGFKATGYDNFFSCYSLPDFKYIGKCISAGRGPEEFITLNYNKQYTCDTSAIKLWISTHVTREILELNLTSSIEKGKTSFEKTIFTDTIPCHYWFNINDSLFASYTSSSNNILYLMYNLKNHERIIQEQIFQDNPLISSDILNQASVMNLNKTKIASAMFYYNCIFINSIDLSENIYLTIYQNPNSLVQINNMDQSDRTQFYSDIRTTEKYIFALYFNKNFKEINSDNHVEIQIFDWNGIPKQKLIINDPIRFFDIDQKNKCIYGLNPENEEIYRYDIKSLNI